MSTKTMHLPPRRNKRKEREDFDALNKPPKPNRPQAGHAEPVPVTVKAEPGKPNLVMAGYLAHEFLTLGTLFGKPWDSARAEPRTTQQQQQQQQSTNSKPKPMDRAGAAETGRIYADVAGLLGPGGAHLPGIVNPTQLARFLHR